MRNQILSAAVIGMALVSVGPAPASAQMAVYDAAQAVSVAKQIAEAKAQLDQLKATYDQVTSQLRKAEQAYDAVTGSRNLGDAFTNPALRQYLPADVRQVYDRARQGGYAGISGTVDQILQSEVLTGTSQQRADAIAERARRSAATRKVVGEDAYAGAQARLAQLDQLQGLISTTQDPKAIAELQARLAVEQAAIHNEAIKLQLLQMAAQAEDKLIEQQKVEYGRAMLNPGNTTMSRIPR